MGGQPQLMTIPSFSGGINQSLSSKSIADNELQDAFNLELGRDRRLLKRYGVTKVKSGGGGFGGPLTSIFQYRTKDALNGTILYTEGTSAWRRAPEDAGTATAFTAIDAAVTLPDGNRTEWCVMDDVAIGVNGGSRAGGKDNPVVITSTTGSLVTISTDSWSGTIPDAPTCIATWNRRLWLVEGNTLYGSALGDRTDWSTTGASGTVVFRVGEDEDDAITGIVPFRGQLVIFKHRRIYVLQAGSPNTDSRQYQVQQVTDQVGCAVRNSVQEVAGDLIFLSYLGVVSLRAIVSGENPILSENIPSLSEVPYDSTATIASITLPHKHQYWLAVPTSSSSTTNDVVWVMDFTNVQQGTPWMKFDGGVVGECYGTAYYNGNIQIYIGGADEAYMYDESTYTDEVSETYSPSSTKFTTKAFNAGTPTARKEFYHITLGLELVSASLDYVLQRIIDTDPNRLKTLSGSVTSESSTGSLLGSPGTDNELWNDALTVGAFIIAGSSPEDTDVVWPIRGDRRGQCISFTFQVDDTTQGFEVSIFALAFRQLSGLFGVGENV